MRGLSSQNSTPKRRLKKAAVFGMFVLVIGTGLPTVDAQINKNKIATGVKIAALEVGGKTKTEALVIVQTAAQSLEQNIFIEFNQQTAALNNVVDLDEIITTAKAFNVGKESNLAKNFLTKLRVRAKGFEIAPNWQINNEAIDTQLNTIFSQSIKPAQDAKFLITFDKQTQPMVSIAAEEAGYTFDKAQTTRDIQDRLNTLSIKPVSLVAVAQEPTIVIQDLEPLKLSIENLLKKPELQLVWQDSKWTVKKDELARWLTVTKENSETKISIDESRVNKYLGTISKEINQPGRDAVFELDETEEKVKTFTPAAVGQKIILDKTAAKISQTILDTLPNELAMPPVELTVDIASPNISTGESNQLGIQERVGFGQTNFKGSPPNRVKNIKRGAALLNNSLIRPNEEFSLLDHLRPFTTENGYYKELVIKAAEGRTTPEIGGGLCQIGTTAFRVALDAGLPITQRQNHSYRVSYYEPPVGMDATIYDPWPDFKFINDTGNYLVLVTRVEGNNLIFELWGTKDGRKVEISAPVVSNYTQPPAKKMIETTDLKPGEVKCTEKAHVGASAVFTYKVTYADGVIKEKEFKSKYRPWQEVCLIGVEKLTEETPTETAPAAQPTQTLPSADVLGAEDITPSN